MLIAALMASSAPALAGTISAPAAVRSAPDTVLVTWSDSDPVDVYVADKANQPISKARLVSSADGDGRHEFATGSAARPYFLLRDTKTGSVVPVAERLIALDKGSNFRDIGGYSTTDGKHVRWGMIYRSGGTPLLTDADVARLTPLVVDMVDLRSSEERVLAPTRLDGVRYSAVGYSMTKISNLGAATTAGPGQSYRAFPTTLAPHLKLIFANLLQNKGPLVYNCTAGQDRTGLTTAMILSVLGVSRSQILQDYHLSTTYRHPENEMPVFDKAIQASNPVAGFFAQYQSTSAGKTPSPLFTPDKVPYLDIAFQEIESKWGSVDNYLSQAVGLSAVDRARLRAVYLEQY
jgi:protein-tyrosine phosphatase